MEYNKEEALRAKALAEKKLQSKDFEGARKIALRAQNLYSDLENISQILMVCDIHCSAQKKLSGAEMDWYGILQLQQTADDNAIKKQYRKFALQLHPDKNKFPGAEAAFKLIGEAQMILLDREKRRRHDMKRGVHVSTAGTRGASFSRAQAPHHTQPMARSGNGVEVNFGAKYATFNNQSVKQPPPPNGFPNIHPTFWTICPFCSVRYQYYRETINKQLTCQNCKKSFVAYDVNVPTAPPTANVDKPRFPDQEPVQNHGYSKVDLGPKRASTAEIRRPHVPQKSVFQSAPTAACNVQSRKRDRSLDEESSESIDSASSSESEEVEETAAMDGHFQAKHSSAEPVRRSGRQRQKVSYKDNCSDDEDERAMSPSESAEGNKQPPEEKESQVQRDASKPAGLDTANQKGHKQKQTSDSEESLQSDNEADFGMETEEKPESYEYPDPEFYDFDKDREEGSFSVGQTWAVYDTREGMPRFYAQIKKVLTPGSKLKVSWLEPSPGTEDETEWVEANLPVSCGKFVLGKGTDIQDRSSFSHLMKCEKGIGKTQRVYPISGETWAIFKNWNIKWHTVPSNHEECEYEFVEILSNYVEDVGVHVACLEKVKSFASLFVQMPREGVSSFQIGPNELYRFSHRVPSFRLTGKEREGVPEGCLELDPASVSANIDEIEFSRYLNLVKQKGTSVPVHDYPPGFPNGKGTSIDEPDHPPGFCHGKGTSVSEADHPGFPDEEGETEPDHLSGSPDLGPIAIPDSDFHNFDDGKSPENFKAGQIWAMYDNEDALPRYYCRISRVSPTLQFEVHIRWLEVCMLPNGVTVWENKDLPICCGRFKAKGGSVVYTDVRSFSHCMKLVPSKPIFLEIYPEKGDVWALYRHWDPSMKRSDLKSCEYDIAEVIERNEMAVKVAVLEHVGGFNSVYKPQLQRSSKVTQEIPVTEILRFSHQVPAFQLSEEGDGNLQGCWEIDTAAMPIQFFRSKQSGPMG